MKNITREYLERYKALRKEIEMEQDRFLAISEKTLGLSRGIGDGMPRGNTKDKDALGLNVGIKDEIEKKLKAALKNERGMRECIEVGIQCKLDDAQQRQVVRLRYIDCLEWSEVRYLMFGKKRDFYDEEEKYSRRTFRIHKKALEKLGKE